MSVKNFSDEKNRGLPLPAYFLYAEDQYMLEDAVLAIKKTIPEFEVDFNFTVFDLDSADGAPTPEDIIDTLNTVSFFASRRYVMVKNFQKLSAKDLKKFQSYISNPSPDAVLVMLYNGTVKKDFKENLKGIKSIGLEVREQDMPSWIKEKARGKGIAIGDEAVEYLVGIAGADLGLLASEVEKLALLGHQSITLDDIREIVEGSRDYSVFDLTGALREKNTEKVFKIYKALSQNLEPYSLLGAINWQYSRMLQTSGASQKDYFGKVFELLNNADIKIKSSGGSFPMEYLLVKLLKL